MAVLAARAVDVAVIVVAMVVLGVIVRTMTMVMGTVVMGMVVVGMVVVAVVAMIGVTMGVGLVSVVVPGVMVIVATGAVVVRRRFFLGTERTLKRRRLAALAADQFRHHRIVEDVERLGRYLGLNVVAAELPGEAGQADRVLRRDRE